MERRVSLSVAIDRRSSLFIWRRCWWPTIAFVWSSTWSPWRRNERSSSIEAKHLDLHNSLLSARTTTMTEDIDIETSTRNITEHCEWRTKIPSTTSSWPTKNVRWDFNRRTSNCCKKGHSNGARRSQPCFSVGRYDVDVIKWPNGKWWFTSFKDAIFSVRRSIRTSVFKSTSKNVPPACRNRRILRSSAK